VPLSFSNPGDEQPLIRVLSPSPPNSPRVTGPLSNEQILKTLENLNKFYRETDAKEEQLKTAVTIVVLQSKE
jgi:hypothetical protein